MHLVCGAQMTIAPPRARLAASPVTIAPVGVGHGPGWGADTDDLPPAVPAAGARAGAAREAARPRRARCALGGRGAPSRRGRRRIARSCCSRRSRGLGEPRAACSPRGAGAATKGESLVSGRGLRARRRADRAVGRRRSALLAASRTRRRTWAASARRVRRSALRAGGAPPPRRGRAARGALRARARRRRCRWSRDRGALSLARAPAAAGRADLHPPRRARSARRVASIRGNAEHDLKPPHEMARLFADVSGRDGPHAGDRGALPFSLDELRYRYPSSAVPDGRTSAVPARLAWEGAVERYRRRGPANVSRAARARARASSRSSTTAATS